jgi:hypothetical protein
VIAKIDTDAQPVAAHWLVPGITLNTVQVPHEMLAAP